MLGEEVAVCLLPLLGSRNGLEFSAILKGNKNWEICGDILDYLNRGYGFISQYPATLNGSLS